MEENLIEKLARDGWHIRAMLNQLPVGILLGEAPSGRIIFGNKQVEHICGHPVILSPDKASYDAWVSYHSDGRRLQSHEYPLAHTLNTGEPAELEVQYQRGDNGVKKWIRISSAPLKDEEGTAIGAIAAISDIDAPRRSMDELRVVRERLEAAINVAELGIWTWQVGGPVIADGNLAAIFGLSEEQLDKGLPLEFFLERVHPDDLPLVRTAGEKAFNTGGRYTPEYRIVGHDGEIRWMAARGKAELDAQGRPCALNGAVLDVTDRKRAEEALRKSEEQFRTLAASIPQLIWSATPDGKTDYFSEQWKEFTGFDATDFLGSRWEELLHPDDRAITAREWSRSVQTGEPYEVQQRLRHRSGEWRWLLTRARAIRNTEGIIQKWVGTSTDIHAQLVTEGELRRANADLEGFSFAAAHDLQEPLRMVTSYTQLMARRFGDKLNAEDRELMDYVVTGARRLSALIQDLLSYTSVSRGNERPKERVDLNLALDQALRQLGSAVAETGATIYRNSLPHVHGYQAHYVQLFQNLISNAIKYQGPQKPVITISSGRKGVDWIISVKDNGMGIDREYHQQIFGIFKRLHNQQIPGTGIGLAICQRVVEGHGGRIWVESEGAGKGSTFRFSVPVSVGTDVESVGAAEQQL